MPHIFRPVPFVAARDSPSNALIKEFSQSLARERAANVENAAQKARRGTGDVIDSDRRRANWAADAAKTRVELLAAVLISRDYVTCDSLEDLAAYQILRDRFFFTGHVKVPGDRADVYVEAKRLGIDAKYFLGLGAPERYQH